MKEHVILVDREDQEIGTMEKLAAHQEGKLHRAFSVFIFNTKGEVLLQKRNTEKYHSGGLWSNTCCSHPRPNETTHDAAHRRLKEEMGLTTELHRAFSFIYEAHLDRGLIEHELDHVFYGISDDMAIMNPLEVEDVDYMSVNKLKEELIKSPENYTSWLKICFEQTINHLQQKNFIKIA